MILGWCQYCVCAFHLVWTLTGLNAGCAAKLAAKVLRLHEGMHEDAESKGGYMFDFICYCIYRNKKNRAQALVVFKLGVD